MSLTPRIIGLAQNGFDPVTIAHMLGLTFAQVNEGLLGQEVGGSGGSESSLIGVRARLSTFDGSGGDLFVPDFPNGWIGEPSEPSLGRTFGPIIVPAASHVCEVSLQGADTMLSPVNVQLLVSNQNGTQQLKAFTPESIDLKTHGGKSFNLHGLFNYPATKIGEDLSLDGEEEPPPAETENVKTAAGGVFFVTLTVSTEPGR